MSTTPVWITPAGLLTTATELTFTSTSVLATGTNVKYSVASGQLPAGMSFSSLGIISGTPMAVSNTVRNEFTIRARSFPYYSDRTFFIDVQGFSNVGWATPSGYLKIGYNGEQYAINKQWINIQLLANIGNDPVTFSLKTGALPDGLSLSASGKITGYVNSQFIEDLPEIYEFTATVSNGTISSDRAFKIALIHPDMLRADSSLYDWVYETFTADNNVASISYLQPLQFLNGNDLGTITPSTNLVSIPVQAYDAAPNRGPVSYNIVNGYLPDGLTLNTSTGIISGYAKRTPEYTDNYQISIAATKTDLESSATVVTYNVFDLKVKGRFESPLHWVTLPNLGTIEKGTVSELYVRAIENDSSEGIKYKVIGGGLPPGITLKYDGTLVGRVSYDAMASYNFTIRATNKLKSRFIDREFTLSIIQSQKHYSEIYLRPFLPIDKRSEYNEFITNESIFVPDAMYRFNDINFGIQRNMKVVLEFGLEQLYQEEYYYAILENFYKKKLQLGTVKTAQGKDSAGNHIYDVIYVEVVDELVNNAGESVNKIVLYPWTRNELYYPASIDNMKSQLRSVTLIDYTTISVNERMRPRYMKSSGNTYIAVMPLCYTLPGMSGEIVRRIKKSGFKFNTVNFEIDRLVVSDTLDKTKDKYIRFDRQALGDLIESDSFIRGPEGWIRLDDEDDQPLLRE